MEGIREPVPRLVHALLRRAVLDHALSERRKIHLPLLHVGVPGGQVTVFAVRDDDQSDHALRADVVAAMLSRTSEAAAPDHVPLVWLTRAGELDLQDVDAQWLASARAAYAEAGASLTFVVVNRRGWRDPRSEVMREWKRLRKR